MNPETIKAAVVAAFLAVVFLCGWKVEGWRMQGRYDTLNAEYTKFRTDAATLGAEAKRHAAVQVAMDKAAKEKADAENATTHARLGIALNSLRDAADRAGSGQLPSAPAGSSRPDLACYDRSELGRAYGSLVAEVRGLADEGTAATVDLNTAKQWHQNLTGASQ